MSRIGKLPILVPSNVKLSITDDNYVHVVGPNGEQRKLFKDSISLLFEDRNLVVIPKNCSRESKMYSGTVRSIIANMIEGVTKGFSKTVIINGVGFKASLKDNILTLSLGYSHPIDYEVNKEITIKLIGDKKLKIEGSDKQLVGMVASDIKRFFKPEPYKGKGVIIDGEFIRRKEGKAVG